MKIFNNFRNLSPNHSGVLSTTPELYHDRGLYYKRAAINRSESCTTYLYYYHAAELYFFVTLTHMLLVILGESDFELIRLAPFLYLFLNRFFYKGVGFLYLPRVFENVMVENFRRPNRSIRGGGVILARRAKVNEDSSSQVHLWTWPVLRWAIFFLSVGFLFVAFYKCHKKRHKIHNVSECVLYMYHPLPPHDPCQLWPSARQ